MVRKKGAATLALTTLGITTPTLMALRITVIRITTHRIMTIVINDNRQKCHSSKMTLRITVITIMTLCIIILVKMPLIKNTQNDHNKNNDTLIMILIKMTFFIMILYTKQHSA